MNGTNEKRIIQDSLKQTTIYYTTWRSWLKSIDHSFNKFIEPYYVPGSLLDTNEAKISKTQSLVLNKLREHWCWQTLYNINNGLNDKE